MPAEPTHTAFLCGGVSKNQVQIDGPQNIKHLNIYGDESNVRLNIPKFFGEGYVFPDEILDLIEIATYIFAADKLSSRGSSRNVELHSWSRRLDFHIKVREKEFWQNEKNKNALKQSLEFMTGDESISFNFYTLEQKPDDLSQLPLFTDEDINLNKNETEVILFSGGLDSLAGTINLLEETDNDLLLVSHKSLNLEAQKQKTLFDSLKKIYGRGLKHLPFRITLKGENSRETTQRSRSLLFSAIAFALMSFLDKNRFFMCENGVTSLNFPKSMDAMNARSSRTTHPKTIGLLESFLDQINDKSISIDNPFIWKTKTDVVNIFDNYNKLELIGESISCSRSPQTGRRVDHCGECFQCLDRRLAMFSSDLDEYDVPYDSDFTEEEIETGKARNMVLNYLKQAKQFSSLNIDGFTFKFSEQLAECRDFVEGANDPEKVENIFKLCQKHGDQVAEALRNIRTKVDHPYQQREENTIVDVINDKEYLNRSVRRFAKDVGEKLHEYLHSMFVSKEPENESELNDWVHSFLKGEEPEIKSEHPTISFANTRVIPDHEMEAEDFDILIEAKYVRGESRPLYKITDEIAADIVKYPDEPFLLLIVCDPDPQIEDDESFKEDIKLERECEIVVIR